MKPPFSGRLCVRTAAEMAKTKYTSWTSSAVVTKKKDMHTQTNDRTLPVVQLQCENYKRSVQVKWLDWLTNKKPRKCSLLATNDRHIGWMWIPSDGLKWHKAAKLGVSNHVGCTTHVWIFWAGKMFRLVHHRQWWVRDRTRLLWGMLCVCVYWIYCTVSKADTVTWS